VSVLFLAALIIGLGVNLVGLVLSGGDDAHGSSGDGTHAGSDAHVESSDGTHAGAGAGLLTVVLSIRFWTYGLLGFGLTGVLLDSFELASPTVAVVVASLTGLGAGAFASWVFNILGRSGADSGGQRRDLLGQTGIVLLPIEPGVRGKVRVRVRGRTLEYLAITDESGLRVGDRVLVEGVGEIELRVGRLPPELDG
jgi:hypothetical protein